MPDTSKDPDTLSFTFDDADRVLGLTRITDEGDLYTRRAEQWAKVQGEDRAVYDRTMRDIAPEQAEEATAAFDKEPVDLMKSDVEGFLSTI